LGPRTIEPYGVRPNELGAWYHRAVEAFVRAAAALPDWPKVPRTQCDALMEEVLQPMQAEWSHGPLGENAQARAMGRMVCDTARRAAWTLTRQLQKGGFRPTRLEFDFGRGENPALVTPMPEGGALYLHGRIDRVDAWRDGETTYLRVVDYKSGKGEQRLDGARLYEGLQQQLPIYLAAALEAEPKAEPAGMFYFRVHDPLIFQRLRDEAQAEAEIEKALRLQGVTLGEAPVAEAQGIDGLFTAKGGLRKAGHTATPEQLRRLLDHTRRKAAGFARRIAEGDIGVRPVQHKGWCSCQYCGYASVCGIDPLLPEGRPRALPSRTLQELHARLAEEAGEV
jgi:ATP-dependent helicase/nuclease subunit B